MTNPTRAGVLVTAASRHGATAEIAEEIGATLRDRGLDTTVTSPERVTALDGYSAVILGSAVYTGRWLADSTELADRIAALETPPPVWIFSSGPIGDPPKPEEDPVDVADIRQKTAARDHRIFAGKIDKSLLSFGERAILIAVRAPEGDYRDWDDIRTWAGEIADTLASTG